jgi:hypothetical protein
MIEGKGSTPTPFSVSLVRAFQGIQAQCFELFSRELLDFRSSIWRR